jgi:hypothetical protein
MEKKEENNDGENEENELEKRDSKQYFKMKLPPW